MAQDHIIWSCQCGEVEARLQPVTGTRCVCYCASCQAFLRHLGQGDLADAQGGSDLFQTTPDRVTFSKGLEKLEALQLTEKGPIRWSTTCCKTPVCNTGAKRFIPLASFLVAGIDEPGRLPDILARINRRDATGRVDGEAGSMRRLVLTFLARALPVLLTGRFRKTPFFDARGVPIRPVARLTPEETRAAYGG